MTSRHFPTIEDLGDRDLYGLRHELGEYLARLKANNDPECIIFGNNTFADRKERWKLKNIVGVDKRLNAMLKDKDAKYDEDNSITYAMPMQSYCWPKMHNTAFPLLCIAPQGTGKTYAHLLYTVAQSIKRVPLNETDKILKGESNFIVEPDDANVDLQDLRNYPRCLIITSTHDLAELIVRAIDRLKINAYEIETNDQGRLHFMPPIARSVSVNQQDDKMIFRCHESEILIGTPAALIKCLKLGAINFARADRVVFDDIDLCLQLWNYQIQELVGIYSSQTETACSRRTASDKSKRRYAQMLMFSRKWTELLKKFITTLFAQRTMIFGSIAEASVYLNIRFELEFYTKQTDKETNLIKLLNFITSSSNGRVVQEQPKTRCAIVCSNEDEAHELSTLLKAKLEYPVRLIDNEQLSHQSNQFKIDEFLPIVILTDSMIDFEVEFCATRQALVNVTHLIHYSITDDMLQFDQRFRLMGGNIRAEARGLVSTVFLGPKTTSKQAKQLYDLFSRSCSTLRSTKVVLRDYMDTRTSAICWRWAAIGLCRFEKLSRDDRFGSYCPGRHALLPEKPSAWPVSGQLKIILTHVVSPSEFYFWFEAHRDIRSRAWSKFQSTGQDLMRALQPKLDALKTRGIRSLPIEGIRRGGLYAVYFQQEARVDRVLLLAEPKQKIERTKKADQRAVSLSLAHINPLREYRQLIPVLRVDYGSRVEVFVENILQLTPELAQVEPQCHRGFHIGFKPTSNEPNWHYKAKRQFHEKLSMQNIRHVTVWLRFNRNKCFWFDNMVVSRQLTNIDSTDVLTMQPHQELVRENLAEVNRYESSFLSPSMRLLTMGKWNSSALAESAQHAFLRNDKPVLDIYLLNIQPDFGLLVRQYEYNKQLIELETELLERYENKTLVAQQHFELNIYCLARIFEGTDALSGEDLYSINRVMIKQITRVGSAPDGDDLDKPGDMSKSNDMFRYQVFCLDHGDWFVLNRKDLFEAPVDCFKTLPFQAISCKLANLNRKLFVDSTELDKTISRVMDLCRTPNNQNKVVKARLDADENLYIYLSEDDSDCSFLPLSSILQEKHKIQLHEKPDEKFERPLPPDVAKNQSNNTRVENSIFAAIHSILRDVIKEELIASGADPKYIEKESGPQANNSSSQV